MNALTEFFETAKKMYALAMPMASVQLISILSSFLCMMMLSKLGHHILAASALIFSTQVSLIVIGSSLLFSLSILIGHAFGAKDFLGIGNFVQQGWTLGLLLSLPLMYIAWHVKTLLLWAGQAPNLVDIVQTFFHWYLVAIPPIMFLITNQQLCYGIHKQYIVTRNNLLSVVLVLIFAYVFIFGKLGMPALGVKGLAIAMDIQIWFSVLFMTGWFWLDPRFKDFQLFQYRVHLEWEYLRKMFEIGWPISVQITAELLSFFAMSVMMGWIGVSALAGYQIVTQYMMLIVVPTFSLAQASGILVGQANGAGEYQHIPQLGMASMLMVFAMTLLTAIIFWTLPRFLASFYLMPTQAHYAETLHATLILFGITAISQIFDGLRNVITGALRGLFDTQFPMWVGVIILWVIGIPLGYVLCFKFAWGIAGLASGMMCAVFIGMLAMWLRWRQRCGRLQAADITSPLAGEVARSAGEG